MSTDFNGMIECNPLAHLYGPDDEDAEWQSAIEVWLLNSGNAYDALAALFGVRNSYGFRPLAEDRGLPNDIAEATRTRFGGGGGGDDVFGTTWITWAELARADWQETDSSGSLSRQAVAGQATHWGPVWTVMRTLADLYGPDNVRLVIWFY
ncbi:hypothetical protein ABZ438_35245 [Streptomyces sp. NPDC005786]|uniref:hypothetical protein n=1 Tax=Streptomyces sp. NPDC005786 TaxID=3154891 RepID=UPI0033C8DE0B